ncbi:MAG TPA: DUF1592 domain-containing protein [Gammaproteobacteria bacterium]|nr:DUF1592 domain-containing protein [Gammaproteobacteria bacterium]
MLIRANLLLALAGAGALLAGCGPSREESLAEHGATVARYCTSCHDDAERTAELSLESLPLTAVAAHPAEWEKVVRKLRAGMMPPVGEPRPAAEARLEFVSWLESELDTAAAADPNPGRTEPFHRLNRAEYRNAVRDLLALDIDVAELLPADEASYGFDNIAGVLKLSPTLLERYLAAADRVSRLAVGTPSEFVDIDWFRVPDDRSQERRLPGLPFGTRGGTLVDYVFPVDGEYDIAAELARDLNEGMPLWAEEQRLEIAVDGERIALFTLPAVPLLQAQAANNDPNAPAISQIVQRFSLGREARAARNRADADWRVRVPVKAGTHEVTATFIARTAALDETARLPFQRPYPAGVNIPETRTGAYLRALEISGPYAASGAGDTASRRRIFSCRPPASGDLGVAESCAREILGALARRAYRRPVRDDDVEPLLAFYRDGAGGAGVTVSVQPNFDAGIQLALKRLLVSPEFLFRIERDPEGVAPGAVYPISDLALASRLSFFLWSSIPDEPLLAAAERGALRNRRELERQVVRMLADERASAFVENFVGQWLYLRNLDAVVPVQSVFPDFDDTLRQGLKKETELFFGSIVHENRSALDLLRADYTFVNERVARLYGLPNIKGNHFRRVTLPADSPRRGLLGHGSLLTVTSYPDRTSPVVRGKWILENLLGVPPPPPPPDVPKLEETSDAGGTLTLRERLTAHRENPSCASCHSLMDPLGFALENFNAVGVWRTLDDTGGPVDTSGTLPDGAAFTGVAEFREALLSSDLFVSTLTEKLLTYGLGRGVEHYDQPAVRAIVREAAEDDYRFSDLILGLVQSPPFQSRRSGS